MSRKLLKMFTSVILSLVILMGCINCVFAVSAVKDKTPRYYEELVYVQLYDDAPEIKELLPGFDIEEIRLIEAGSKTLSSYSVQFTEKNNSIVKEAVDILKESHYVSKVHSSVKSVFILGEVIVNLRSDAPSIESLFPEFKIESMHRISMKSSPREVYAVQFTEKSNEIIYKAIEAVKDNPYVNKVEPCYDGDCYNEPIDEPTSPYVTTEPSSVTNSTTASTTTVNTTVQPITEPTEFIEIIESTKDLTVIKGDANGDGVLSISDVTCIQKYLAKVISEQDINYTAANISGTGNLSISDATSIQMKLAGFTDKW